MAGPKWRRQPSGFEILQDDTSRQSSYADDPRFFLRRCKSDLAVFTDLLSGDLSEDVCAELLVEFITLSGGLGGDRLVFEAIATQDADKQEIAATFDRISAIAKSAAALSRRTPYNSYLNPNGYKWDAVVELQPATDFKRNSSLH